MSVMQSTVSSKDARMIAPPTDDVIFDKDKIIGCMYLMAAVLVLSSNIVLQVFFKNNIGGCFSFLFLS